MPVLILTFLVSLILRDAAAQPQGPFDVTAFGAVPDDGLDDRAPVTAALDAARAAGGGEVYFPSGTYDLTVPEDVPTGSPVVVLPLGCNGLELRGDTEGTSRIRLLGRQPSWERVLGAPRFGQAGAGLVLRHLVLDGNGVANPVDGDDDVDDLHTERRHALPVYVGNDIAIEHAHLVGWRHSNVRTTNPLDTAVVRVPPPRLPKPGRRAAGGR